MLISLLFQQASATSGARGTISGELRLPDGTAAQNFRVGARRIPGTGSDTDRIVVFDSITATDALGRYRLENVPAGQYYVVAGTLTEPTYYPGASVLSGAGTVTIEAGSLLQGIDFGVAQAREPIPVTSRRAALREGIEGGIKIEGGGSWPRFLPALYIYVENGPRRRAVTEDGRKIRGTGTFGATPVSPNGHFKLYLESGEYPVSLVTSLEEPLSAADGYYVKSMSSGDVDLLKEKLKVDGSARQSITITLAATP